MVENLCNFTNRNLKNKKNMKKSKRTHHAEKRERQEVWKTTIAILAVVLGVIFLVCVLIFGPEIFPKAPKSMMQKHEERFRNLFSRIPTNPVDPAVTPVHIWSEVNGVTNFCCTGGLLNMPPNPGKFILTCGHAFWNISADAKPARYYFQILQPYSRTLYGINAIEKLNRIDAGKTHASRDVIFCKVGTPETITPINDKEQDNGYRDLHTRFSKQDTIIAYSTITGQPVECVGQVKLDDGTTLVVLDYLGTKGESGTIFSDKNGSFFISSRIIPVTGLVHTLLGVPLEHQRVIVCSMVRAN